MGGRRCLNGRQRERKYRATFIDQGFCFNAGEWSFPDSPLRGVYARNIVYRGVTGWSSFEPWLSRIEALDGSALWKIAEAVPPEWYGGNTAEIERLMETMLKRRGRVRELIDAFRGSDREPFPMWSAVKKVVVPSVFAGDAGSSKFVM